MRSSLCLSSCAVAALLVGSTGALAQTAPVVPNPTPPTSAIAKPKQVCRREQVTGSNMPQRTCHTVEDWHQINNPSQGERQLRSQKYHPG